MEFWILDFRFWIEEKTTILDFGLKKSTEGLRGKPFIDETGALAEYQQNTGEIGVITKQYCRRGVIDEEDEEIWRTN